MWGPATGYWSPATWSPSVSGRRLDGEAEADGVVVDLAALSVSTCCSASAASGPPW